MSLITDLCLSLSKKPFLSSALRRCCQAGLRMLSICRPIYFASSWLNPIVSNPLTALYCSTILGTQTLCSLDIASHLSLDSLERFHNRQEASVHMTYCLPREGIPVWKTATRSFFMNTLSCKMTTHGLLEALACNLDTLIDSFWLEIAKQKVQQITPMRTQSCWA